MDDHLGLGDGHWVRTIGSARPGDPRDGELHRFSGPPPNAFDLEPYTEDDEDLRYVRRGEEPFIEDDGRSVWRYVYSPR